MNCPQPQLLQHLLDEALPADQMQTIQAHLESCRACQDTIETLAAGGVTWDKAAQNLSDDQTPVEPALFDAVEKLQGASVRVEHTLSEIAPPAHADDLSFLQPPQAPGSLGRLEEFEIQSVVGKGGFGIVLKAFDTNLHRIVAIKAMLPHMAASGTARQRFNKEARAAAAITHENVVTIHAVKGDAKIPYFAMQFVSGQTLSEKIDTAGPLSVKEILRIAMQIAEGLAAAHKQGLVHRDIKPANILLENGVERVKITDFGLARAVDDASLTQSGTVAGTPMYMSPEQANGEHIDHRSDLFSLGSVLYVMCTGRAPFRASSTMAVLKRVCDDTPTPVQQVNADIPDWLCAIIERLHAKKPGDRFQTAKEVAEVLGQHLAQVQQPLQTLVAAPSTMVADRADAAKPRPISTPGRAVILWPILYGLFIGAVVGCAIVLTNPTVIGASVWPGVAWCAGLGSLLGAAVGMVRFINAARDRAPGVGEASSDVGRPARSPRGRLVAATFLIVATAAVLGAFAWWRLTTPATLALTFRHPDAMVVVEGRNSKRDFRAEKPGHGQTVAEFVAGQYRLTVFVHGEETQSDVFTLAPGEFKEWIIEPVGRVQVTNSSDQKISFHGPGVINPVTQLPAVVHVGPRSSTVVASLVGPHKWYRSGTLDDFSNIAGEFFVKPGQSHVLNVPADNTATDGWVQLFNGRDLDGWKTHPDQVGGWSVEGGELVGRSASAHHLFSERGDFQDFHLRTQVKLNEQGNSGIYFRSNFAVDRNRKYPTAYEVQILHRHASAGLTGCLQVHGTPPIVPPYEKVAILPDQWFNLDVIALGKQLTIKVNGKETTKFSDDRYHQGYLVLQAMVDTGVKDATVVHFKKIEIKELPPTPTVVQPSERISAIGMKFARIPKGISFLGGGDGNVGTRKVEFKEDFYLGIFEVTQEEWQSLMGANPSGFHHNGSDLVHTTDITKEDLKRFPVEKVSWHDCQEFLARLNKKAPEKGWIYRLPTSNEWEYACRGGPPIKKEDLGFHYYFDVATNVLLRDRASFWEATMPIRRTDKVGSFPANRLGLHDMHGNVDEWCADEIVIDKEKHRVTRGGSWGRPASDCQAQATNHYAPTVKSYALGFRVARVKGNPMPPAAETPPLAVAPLNEQQAKSLQNDWAQHLGVEVEIKNSINMKFRLIPPGGYDRGATEDELDATEHEKPRHRVLIQKPFYLGVTEVTLAQFKEVMGLGNARPDFPAVGVSWLDAVQFCKNLSARPEEKKAGRTYRLVADAEWEYACRAGTVGPYFFGSIENIGAYSWVQGVGNDTKKVATRKPNPWGLHDMIGNVHEWCADEYRPYEKDKVEHDPQKAFEMIEGDNHVVRYSSIVTAPKNARSAARLPMSPRARNDIVGFRVVMIGGW